MSDTQNNRQAGRPRCEQAKDSILSATRRLFESYSLRDLTIEAIAKEAGVSKATIYRWWSNKPDLVMDACIDELRHYTGFRAEDGDPVSVVTSQMRRLIEVYAGPVGRIVCQLLAEGQYQPDICEKFFQNHGGERCRHLREMLGGHADDIGLLADLLYGPIYFRLIRHYPPMDKLFADGLVEQAAKTIAEWRRRYVPNTDAAQ